MTKHINPGTDTTINPVVIDDSYRERKQEYDPIFIGLINYFKDIQWQRVESDISVTEIIEILTDFAKMEAEEKASYTPAPSQQRVDAAIKMLQITCGKLSKGHQANLAVELVEAITLLQEQRP